MKPDRGPYLWLLAEENGTTQWLIIHGRKHIATAFHKGQQQEALAELEDYAEHYRRLPKAWKPTIVVPRHTKPLFVYFISTDDVRNFPIKIGITDNPTLRLAGLQCGCPYTLTILATVEAVPSVERSLHIGFGKYRLSGEWFKRHRTLLKYIAEINGTPRAPPSPVVTG